MQMWIVTVGEPLPTDPGDNRLLRSGLLAQMLAAAGHEVTWWSSTFNHQTKNYRTSEATPIEVQPGLRLELLHASGYGRNLSWARHLHHRQTARRFAAAAAHQSPPDLILCSLPTLELCVEATRIGLQKAVPVVLDIRDLWPDVFLDLVPRGLQGLARWFLQGMYRDLKRACRDATAIVGVTDEFVDWGLVHAGRPASQWDASFPLAYPKKVPDQAEIDESVKRWCELGVNPNDFNVCFFGTLGRQFDIATVITAARQLEQAEPRLRFVICGDGEKLQDYRRSAQDLHHVLFPGWVSQTDIWALMRMCSVGLAPYLNTSNFRQNIPNKPIEYLSAGLPVVSSLQGAVAAVLHEGPCGITYRDGDAKDLAQLLADLSQDPDRLRKMSRNATALFERRFVAEQSYARMVAHMECIARENASAGRRQI